MHCSPSAQEALRGAFVVLPAVTYANVGELALDVLVTSLAPVTALGPLESANCLPVVGNDAFDQEASASTSNIDGGAISSSRAAGIGVMTTALELFAIPGSQPPLVFLQQRAPAALGRQAAFAEELVTWLRQRGAAGVVVLTGLDAQLRRDRQLDSSPFRFLTSSEHLRSACAAASALHAATAPPPLDPYTYAAGDLGGGLGDAAAASSAALAAAPLAELEPELRAEELQLHHSLPPWPLLSEADRQGLPYALLGCFAAEGDNAGEGVALAAHAVRLLEALAGGGSEGKGEGDAGARLHAAAREAGALRTPRSWVGLYGRSFPQEIF
ncbi:hypothetical protein HYH02_012253 [Chlamydomonas schloesseri]|uniref:Proteasome assembly chaperone 2 n=1 Tax=Chlamydomonas schloesseri TaxID=2026947 RepID=A0A835SWJ6_9CHLO|nr:hypothetical protein HYH02_012253 [Chlamydomonas schloesseri]|eukprot:KAG2434423.1 hypothetical protein HYH02_012253 [Chlamydomonas schloesseri]